MRIACAPDDESSHVDKRSVGPSCLALLADPDDDSRAMYATYLRFSGWKTIDTPDGRHALARARAARVDVVVTESRLFGIDGYELCELLRRDPATRTVPIVMVTADVFPADIVRGYAAGADIVLTKPCLPDALLDNIRHLRARSARACELWRRLQLARLSERARPSTGPHRTSRVRRAS